MDYISPQTLALLQSTVQLLSDSSTGSKIVGVFSLFSQKQISLINGVEKVVIGKVRD